MAPFPAGAKAGQNLRVSSIYMRPDVLRLMKAKVNKIDGFERALNTTLVNCFHSIDKEKSWSIHWNHRKIATLSLFRLWHPFSPKWVHLHGF